MSSQESPYVELRCKSWFSFLSSTVDPDDLAKAAVAAGYKAVGLVDSGSVSGLPRFHKAARREGLSPILGGEVVVDGAPLALLCETAEGYRNLCRLITTQHSTARGGRGLSLFDLESHHTGLIALTGGGEGKIGRLIDDADLTTAERKLDTLSGIFGPSNLFVELQLHFEEQQDRRNAALRALADSKRLPLLLTNDARMVGRDELLLLDALTCIREKVQLQAAGKRLLQNGERFLKPAREMASLLPDLPAAVQNTVEIAGRCSFSLDALGYRFPQYPLPHGESPEEFLRAVVFAAADDRFRPCDDRVRRQLTRELDLICKLGLSGYFLIVWDLIEFCRSRGILVQGRGSAANSAVCFALGITACDPLKMDLLFERFLSEERGEWPDIDLDLPSGSRREEVIQYIYRKYGPAGCGLTATFTTYRARSAVRDLGKILGFSDDSISPLAKKLSRFGDELGPSGSGIPDSEPIPFVEHVRSVGLDPSDRNVAQLVTLYEAIQDIPRHIGQHPGGMVIAAGRLDEVVPIQPATMPGRAIIQWDKDDCADLGIVKIDLLGLGMMAVLEEAGKMVPYHDGQPFDMAALPKDDPAVYSLIARADTVGVFQVESRAQMSCLPRTRPSKFYDLVVQVGLIRPGPIVGKMVHPYLKRCTGEEPVSYAHPSLAPILERTLGIPLFQEQVMKMAMVAAGFSGGLADQLRRAMDSKNGSKKMRSLVEKLRTGMEQRGIGKEAAQQIEAAITAFAQYGFPESHAISFAWLTYASAYLKVHHPGVFYTALLNAWPMGFYHPATVIRDAQRQGVIIRAIDVNTSQWQCSLEHSADREVGYWTADAPDNVIPFARSPWHVAPLGVKSPPVSKVMRIGLRYVHGLRKSAAESLLAARAERPFADLTDLMNRCRALSQEEIAQLAELGALSSLQPKASRREAIWQVSKWERQSSLPLTESAEFDPSPLREMSQAEELQADLLGSGVTVGPHPLSLLRTELHSYGVQQICELSERPHKSRARVAGVCIIRQRPPTAKGFMFLTLEDESGLLNVIVSPQLLTEQRPVIYGTRNLVIDGVIERNGTAIQLRADRFRELQQVIEVIGHRPTASQE